MKATIFVALIAVGLAAAGPASAACRRFGTQIDCALGESRLVIGTQAEPEPRYATSLRPQAFHGDGAFRDDRTARSRLPARLQDIGNDPSLCRRIGNESTATERYASRAGCRGAHPRLERGA
jgi:hypothetical protein